MTSGDNYNNARHRGASGGDGLEVLETASSLRAQRCLSLIHDLKRLLTFSPPATLCSAGGMICTRAFATRDGPQTSRVPAKMVKMNTTEMGLLHSPLAALGTAIELCLTVCAVVSCKYARK